MRASLKGRARGAPREVAPALVTCLFVSTCLLSAVSWYTTFAGCRLYLGRWFALIASLGIQSALVFVAWLVGVSRSKRTLLIAVYAIAATVSIAFSYVSLFRWFSAGTRPAEIERKLYDTLQNAAGRTESILVSAAAEGQKHVLALEEMARTEEARGYISLVKDRDPYLERVLEAVAEDARSYSPLYPQGPGSGLRYAAFQRYTDLTQQSVERIIEAQKRLARFRNQAKPLAHTELQLRDFRQAVAAIPWTDVQEQLDGAKVEPPKVPAYSSFVDHAASGQEDLLISFKGLFTHPTNTRLTAMALAVFIDVTVFILAFAAGPHFSGASQQTWFRAGALLDQTKEQDFLGGFLRKCRLIPGSGVLSLEESSFSAGQQHLCALLAAKGLVTLRSSKGSWVIDPHLHEFLMESLAGNSGLDHEKAGSPDIRRELAFVSNRPESEQLRLAKMLRPVISAYLVAARAAKDLATESEIFELRGDRETDLASCLSGLAGQIGASGLAPEAKEELSAYLSTTAYEQVFNYTEKEE